jgi:branched-chain amino acid transport system substrate-binding protein
MIPKRYHLAAFAVAGTLVIASCGSSSTSSATTTKPTTTVSATTAPSAASSTVKPTGSSTADTTGSSVKPTDSSAVNTGSSTVDTNSGSTTPSSTGADSTTSSSGAPAKAWTVDTSKCPDQAAVEAPITGTLTIGSVQPLSGTPAVAFAPVTDGFKLYLDYANKNKLLDGITLAANIKDDQYDATQTPGAVSSLIDSKVNIFSGIIGTGDNQAVVDTLNQECIPQLLNLTGAPEWGNVAKYPWTTGALVPYDIEARIYATALKGIIGNGGTVGLFTVNNDFGKTFADAFKKAATANGLKVVVEQTIEEPDQAPPTNQVGAIAAAKPDAVMTVPLGLQCPIFLKELVNAKAASSGWDPKVFMTNTCASHLLITLLAAGAGDKVYTSTNILDPADPANAANPGVKAFTDAYNAAGLKGDVGTTAVGWSVAEDTVAILVKAQKAGTLTRKSIIEAARNSTFTPSLGIPGAQYKMNGETDGFSFQTLQVEQWNEATKSFTNIGTPDSSSES